MSNTVKWIISFLGGVMVSGALFFVFQGREVALSPIDFVFLVLAIVSSVLAIVAIIFSWVFYENGQKLNQETIKILSDITQKISKIDDIVTKQFDKVLSKAIGIEYQGDVPISDIQLLNKLKKNKKR